MPDKIKPPPPSNQQPNGTQQPLQPVVPPRPPLPNDLGHLDDIFQCDVDWFFTPASQRDPDACMPDSIKPPPAPKSSSQTSLSQSWQSVSTPLPVDLGHLDDVFQNDCTWYWGPDSARDAVIAMLDSIKPPPMPNSDSNTNGSSSPTARRQSTRSINDAWLQTPLTGSRLSDRLAGNKRKDMT